MIFCYLVFNAWCHPFSVRTRKINVPLPLSPFYTFCIRKSGTLYGAYALAWPSTPVWCVRPNWMTPMQILYFIFCELTLITYVLQAYLKTIKTSKCFSVFPDVDEWKFDHKHQFLFITVGRYESN